MTSPRFAVLGAGNGGQAFAGHLALLGEEVRLFDVDAERVEAIAARGRIELSGAIEGSGSPALITADLRAAVEGADVVLIVVPACYHESLAERLAPCVSAGQIVVLNPGATGGALAVRNVLGAGGAAGVTVAETESLLYACRSSRPGEVSVYAVKDEVRVGAIPARATAKVCERLAGPFASFTPVPDVLHTSFGNLNPLVHPAPTLLSAGRIESGQSFEFYREGMTPTIVRVVEALDEERRAVARAYDVDAPSLEDSLRAFYGVTESGLYEIFRNSRAHEGVLAPSSVDSRYLFEDVPTGLVPIAELGRAGGVATPVTTSFAHVACAAAGRDFWSEGRTLERLGLAGLTVERIRAVATG